MTPPKLWIKIGSDGAVLDISTTGCTTVIDFIRKIKQEDLPGFEKVHYTQIQLHAPGRTEVPIPTYANLSELEVGLGTGTIPLTVSHTAAAPPSMLRFLYDTFPLAWPLLRAQGHVPETHASLFALLTTAVLFTTIFCIFPLLYRSYRHKVARTGYPAGETMRQSNQKELIQNQANEGIPNVSFTLRQELVSTILKMMVNQRVLMVQSPPSSGKTALAELVRHHLVTVSNVNLVCLTMSKAQLQNGLPTITWNEFFFAQTKIHFSDYLENNNEYCEERYLIIDESQITFQMEKGENPLWQQCIKTLLGRPAFNGLKIMLFASHGSFVKTNSTFGSLPVKLPPEVIIGLRTTALSSTEYDEMVATSVLESNSTLLPVLQSRTVSDAILAISGNHIGVAHYLIAGCISKYRSSPRSDLIQCVLDFLNDTNHLWYIQNRIRQLPTIKELQRLAEVNAELCLDSNGRAIFDQAGRLVTDQSSRFGKLLQILRDVAFGVDRPVSPDSLELRALLGQAGILSLEETDVCFSSPIHCATFVNSLRSSQYHEFQPPQQPCHELQLNQLVQLCVERMRSSYLIACGAETSEKQYHFEFWRALAVTLPREFLVLPEFKITDPSGSLGWVDIRIQWGPSVWLIELLRDGDRVDEHVKRFEPQGRYASVPAKDIAIVDFRKKSVRKSRRDLTYVIFEDSFRTAKLMKTHSPIKKITLMP